MRLLQYNDGDLSLTTFFANKTPQKYAILSHTWGAEEVTFEDLQKRTYGEKAGYKKIRFCGEQARRDGLQYFWVDTCCINKSSSAELTEAINSMFRWYRESTKCYVYLSDVSRSAVDIDDLGWEVAFRKSKWFTRGWTLQELIAPTLVEFFSEEGELLGNQLTLEGHICEIARLPAKALQGSPLSDFSITSRMSWAEQRETTCEEDQAYSLLGIFDVNMQLNYGEGREKAFGRLREEIDKALKGVKHEDLSVALIISNIENKTLAQQYQCHPLETPTTIRLVHLNKGSGDDPISARLTHAILNKWLYQALSYEWGVECENDPRIILDGVEIHIRQNLWSALWNIRRADRDLVLWIDALCINQNDKVERGHQLQVMGRIFSYATRVLVWLGTEGDGSDEAMDAINGCRDPAWIAGTEITDSLAAASLERLSPKPSDLIPLLRKVEALLNRPYWRRIWIVQEYNLAATLKILCGSKSVSESTWSYLFAVIASLSAAGRYWKRTTSYSSTLEKIRVVEGIASGNMARWHHTFRQKQSQLSLYALLQICVNEGFAASEPRDIIHGILGMAIDVYGNNDLCDYKIPVRQLFINVIRFIGRSVYTRDLAEELLDLRPIEYADEFAKFVLGDMLPGRLGLEIDDEIRAVFDRADDRGYLKLPW